MPQKPFKDWVDDLLGRKEYHRYLEKETRTSRIQGQLLAIANTGCALFYLVWCLLHANWSVWYLFVPFFVTEVAFFILFILWGHLLWNKRHHAPAGLERPVDLSVDIFIPCCGEPLDIIERTVTAATLLSCQKKIVHILDDGAQENVRELAERLGVNYIRREVRENRKAGNLNHALALTSGDLILALDADQVAAPEIIDRIISYFSLPYIAFVQTPQTFDLPENDPWGNSDEVFYKVMQPGKDYDNAAISCGSGVIYRRKALEEIGGFSTWNLVEDLHTSMNLHDRCWKSVFHEVPYTKGTAPVDPAGNLKQRWQWATDSLRMFFWDNPLFRKGLTIDQKLQYFHFGYNYLVFGIFMPIFFVLPIWSLFTHQFMLNASPLTYLIARFPYFCVYILTNQLLTDKIHSFKSFQVQAGLFGAYFNAVITALRAKNTLPHYTVTSKKALQGNFLSRLYCCLPHIIISCGAVAAIIYGMLTMKDDFWFLAVNIFWCIWVIVVLSRFIGLSLFSRMFIK